MNPYSILKGGFMPNVVMESEISHASKVCYMALAYFAGKDKDTCWPSQTTLAAKYNSNERSTREHLTELQDAGFIKVFQNGLRKSNTYEFLSLEDYEVRAAENRRSRAADSADQGTAENRRSGSAENRRSFPSSEPLPYEPLSYKEGQPEELSPLSEKTNPPIPEEISVVEENPHDPARVEAENFESQSTSKDLQFHREVFDFVKWVYGQVRGRKTSMSEIKRSGHALTEAEASMGKEDFRTALWNYLETHTGDLQAKKWPIWIFSSNPSRYLNPIPAYRASHSAPPAPSRPRTSSESQTSAPVKYSEILPDPACQYVDRWHILVPEDTEDLLEDTLKKITKWMSKADFVKYFEFVADKCQLMLVSGKSKYTLNWLVANDFEPGWKKIVTHQCDNDFPKQTELDKFQARVEREEREKGAAE